MFANDVGGLEAGIYRYDAGDNALVGLAGGDPNWFLQEHAGVKGWVANSPLVLMVCGLPNRLVWKYEAFSYRVMLLDSGVVVGNLYLLAEALGLAASAVAQVPPPHAIKALGIAEEMLPTILFVISGQQGV